MSASPIFIGSYRNSPVSIRAGNNINPLLLWTAGASGSRIHAINVMSSDAGANSILLYLGKVLSLQANMGVGTLVDGAGGDDTLTRTVGSFITDGWKIGDLLILQGCTTLANDFAIRLTAVATLTLTFATGTISAGEVLPTGASLIRGQKITTQTVAIDSGNVGGTASVSVLDSTALPFLDATPNRYLTLGASDLLLVSAGTLLGAAEFMDVIAMGGDY